MNPLANVLIFYVILGLLMIVFNKKIGNLYYKFVVYYTKKLSLRELFLFRVDYKNKNSLLMTTRFFSIVFGIFLTVFSFVAFFL